MRVQTGNVLAKFSADVIILAVLTPWLAKESPGQLLALSLIIAAVLYLVDLTLLPLVLELADNRVAAAGDGLVAAVVIRFAAPALGMRLGWGGAILLGAALGLGEFFLHRWEGATAKQQ